MLTFMYKIREIKKNLMAYYYKKECKKHKPENSDVSCLQGVGETG